MSDPGRSKMKEGSDESIIHEATSTTRKPEQNQDTTTVTNEASSDVSAFVDPSGTRPQFTNAEVLAAATALIAETAKAKAKTNAKSEGGSHSELGGGTPIEQRWPLPDDIYTKSGDGGYSFQSPNKKLKRLSVAQPRHPQAKKIYRASFQRPRRPTPPARLPTVRTNTTSDGIPREALEPQPPPLEDPERHRRDYFDCKLSGHRYEVSAELRISSQARARFFFRVLLVKLVQMVIVNTWFAFNQLLVSCQSLKAYDHLYTFNRDWISAPYIVYFLIHVGSKYCFCSRQSYFRIMNVLLISTICVTMVVSAAWIYLEPAQRITIEVAIYSLALQPLFMVVIYLFKAGRLDLLHNQVFGYGFISTFLTSTSVYLCLKFVEQNEDVDFARVPQEYGPAFAATLVPVMAFMYEVRTVLQGRRFAVGVDDWLFVAMAT